MKIMSFFIFTILLLSGCVSTLPALITTPDNTTAEFDGLLYRNGDIQPQTLKRAAGIAQRRGFEYFTLEIKQQSASNRPQFTFDYGRNPYGFGNAGSSMPSGLTPAITTTGSMRTHWLARFYNANNQPSQADVYSVQDILRRK